MKRNSERSVFKKESRLCSQKRIEELFKGGKHHYSSLFRLSTLPGAAPNSRVVISVPKRNFKKAVERNRIKRIIREVIRKSHFLSSSTPPLDIAILFRGKELPSYKEVEESLNNVLEKIEKGSQKGGNIPLHNVN